MNVRELIENLAGLDPEAEVIIDAPLHCSRGPSYSPTGNLILPVILVKVGRFPHEQFWVSIQGTDTWGLNCGVEKD
jgi:hypothetical protein